VRIRPTNFRLEEQLLVVIADGARTGRCDLILRQEAYSSAVNHRGSQLSYGSLEFNFALQRANDVSQLAHTIGIL
jgi:hypothetical protein